MTLAGAVVYYQRRDFRIGIIAGQGALKIGSTHFFYKYTVDRWIILGPKIFIGLSRDEPIRIGYLIQLSLAI